VAAIPELLRAWDEALEDGGRPDLGVARELAYELIRAGEPFRAYDIACRALADAPADVRLRQIKGYALTQAGAPREAHAILRALYDEGHRDGETLGMLARACKELGRLDEAFAHYDEGYRVAVAQDRVGDAYYTGINAATTAMLLGRPDDARARAAEVRDRWAARDDSYWAQATLGEAALLHGDLATAQAHYARAAEAAAGKHAHVASMARQARLVAEALGLPADALDGLFRLPAVVVFAGHMLDAADRAAPRFPAACEIAVARLLAERLDALGAGIGYASGACGGDLLFCEAMLARGGEVHLTLPCPPDEFVARSVAYAREGWVRRFHAVRERASTVLVASGDRALDNPLSFEYANRILLGRACLHAASLAGRARGLALWDGAAGDGPGGTATAVERWRARGLDVDVVAPRDAGGPGASRPVSGSGSDGGTDGDVSYEFASILFADAVGFSRLNERQVRAFSLRYLGAIAELVACCEEPPTARNTWGDGLYVVFRTPEAAGRFALDLVDLVLGTDWAGPGAELPADLNIRVALHAGPTYAMTDPLTDRPTYMGSHVSRAARIEPITPPGHVYASGAFAAMAAADGVTSFSCEYCGRVPLAKGYGTFPLYHVVRGSKLGPGA